MGKKTFQPPVCTFSLEISEISDGDDEGNYTNVNKLLAK